MCTVYIRSAYMYENRNMDVSSLFLEAARFILYKIKKKAKLIFGTAWILFNLLCKKKIMQILCVHLVKPSCVALSKNECRCVKSTEKNFACANIW